MERVWTRMLAVSVLLWGALGWAAAADRRAGGGPETLETLETLRGGYVVTFNISLGRALPGGGAILCRAHLAPNLAAGAKTRWASAGTASGVATVTGATVNGFRASGSRASCTVQVPVRWEVEGGGNGGAWASEAALSNEAALSYEIDAVSGAGAEPYAVRVEHGIGVPLPAQNSVQSLQIYVLF